MPGGLLQETENRRISQISDQKKSSLTREFLKQYLTEKVVTSRRWLLMRSGRYERVDCTRTLGTR